MAVPSGPSLPVTPAIPRLRSKGQLKRIKDSEKNRYRMENVTPRRLSTHKEMRPNAVERKAKTNLIVR